MGETGERGGLRPGPPRFMTDRRHCILLLAMLDLEVNEVIFITFYYLVICIGHCFSLVRATISAVKIYCLVVLPTLFACMFFCYVLMGK